MRNLAATHTLPLLLASAIRLWFISCSSRRFRFSPRNVVSYNFPLLSHFFEKRLLTLSLFFSLPLSLSLSFFFVHDDKEESRGLISTNPSQTQDYRPHTLVSINSIFLLGSHLTKTSARSYSSPSLKVLLDSLSHRLRMLFCT